MNQIRLQPEKKLVADINYHLQEIATSCSRLKLDYNTDLSLFNAMNNIITRLQLVAQLVAVAESSLLLELANSIKSIFGSDSEISQIIINFKNHKRTLTNNNIAHLTFDYGIK